MSSNQVYVITGATGWLGRECLEHLISKGILADNIYLFASKQQTLEMPFGNFAVYPIDTMKDFLLIAPVVFHFAYLTRDKVKVLGRQNYTDACLKITSTITEALKKWSGATLCYASSGAVYDNQYKADYFEKNPYGFLKFMDECYFKELCNNIGSRLIIPRIFNISGRHTQNRSQYALTSFIDQAIQTDTIQINAQHDVIRSYISARELIELCLLWMNNDGNSDYILFDACSNEVVELNQIACMVAEKIEKPLVIKRERNVHVQADLYVGDVEAIQELCRYCNFNLSSLSEQIDILLPLK